MMKIDKDLAKSLYNNEVPQWFKDKLETVFGKELFNWDYKTIKTFEDACQRLKIYPQSVFSLDDDTPDEIGYKKLKVITKAINDGWTPDWSDQDEQKWFPIHLFHGSATCLVFSYSGDAASRTSDVYFGSRLCFHNKEKSDYAGKQFIDLYEEFLK